MTAVSSTPTQTSRQVKRLATPVIRKRGTVGAGRYDVPSFLLKGDANYDQAKWKATVTSIQVARLTYRFHGAMKSGPAVGAVVLNQDWTMSSVPLDGETRFRTLSVGVTAGYYVHAGWEWGRRRH